MAWAAMPKGMNDRLAQGSPKGGPAAIFLSGEYDLARREELERELSSAGQSDTVVLDLSDVTYLDSTALTCFIRLRKRMMARGECRIRLAGVRPQIRRLFQVSNLDQVFELE